MSDCERKETCGGLFSSGPGDSDWQFCDRHKKDVNRFNEIYESQIDQSFIDIIPSIYKREK